MYNIDLDYLGFFTWVFDDGSLYLNNYTQILRLIQYRQIVTSSTIYSLGPSYIGPFTSPKKKKRTYIVLVLVRQSKTGCTTFEIPDVLSLKCTCLLLLQYVKYDKRNIKSDVFYGTVTIDVLQYNSIKRETVRQFVMQGPFSFKRVLHQFYY